MRKRILSTLLALLMVFALFPENAWAANIVDSGTCGDNLTWTLTNDGTMTISGSGEMVDYDNFDGSNPNLWSTGIRSSVLKVLISQGVTSIGASSFEGFSCLKEVSLSNTLKQIGKTAFSRCSALEKIELPEGIEQIGEQAFGYCAKLESLTIPKSVTAINFNTFLGCNGLTSIYIPENVKSISGGAFRCGLKSIEVSEDNNYFCSINGVLFNKEKTTLVAYPRGKENTTYKVPNGVASISAWAFGGNLTSIYFPSSLKSIGIWALQIPDLQAYFEGNAPKVTPASAMNSSFDESATLYYKESTSGWTPPTWNGYKLEVWDGGSPGDDPNTPVSGDGNYYARTENRLFRVYALNSRYPCPIGFAVGVGEASYTGYQSGNHFCDDIKAVIPESYSGNVTVSRDGYYTYQIPAELTDNCNVVMMVPTSITGPFSQALLLDKSYDNIKFYSNLLGESAMLYEPTLMGDTTDILKLYPVVDWNGHGEGKILLIQGEKQVELKNNTFNEVNMATCRFVANKPVYLQIVGADGVKTQTETGIHIYERWKNGISIDLGAALEVDTEESGQEEVDILEGESLKLDFSSWSDDLVPITFSIKEDGTITGTIGLTFADGSYKEAAFGKIKEMLTVMMDPSQRKNLHKVASYLSDLKKQGTTPALSHSSWGVSGDAQIIGYFSGNILDGRVGLTEAKMALLFEGSASYTWNTVVPVLEIPAYVKVALKAQVEGYLKMIYDEQLDKLTSDGKHALNGSVGISAETGPGWEGYVSAGIKGSGNVKAYTVLPISQEDTFFSLQTDLSVVGSLAGIRGSWKLISSPEMVFWDAGEWCWKDKDSGKIMTQFVPDLDINLMNFSGAWDSIADGVSGYNPPALAQISDEKLLAVWVADVEYRSAVDKGGIYYSVLDNGTWSQPELVYDDKSNDSTPQLYQRDGVTYLAWQNYTTTFNTDILSDYDTIAAQMENVTSQFDPDNNQWSQPVVETPDWYLADVELPADYEREWPITGTVRQVVGCDGVRAVLYSAVDEDSQYQVYGIFDTGDGWGSPVQVTEAPEGVNGFSAILDENNLSILYTTGDVSAASLVLQTSAIEADLSVNYADYLPETLVPGNTLTLAVSLQNSGSISIDGAHISVLINGNEIHQEDVDVALKSGEEELLFIGYHLPEEIDFTSLDVKAVPISGGDADLTDNIATCTLELSDLSLEEVSAIQVGNVTQVLTQVVNRGQNSTTPVAMTFHKDTSDGETIGTIDVPALNAGELISLTVELSGLNVGDMVYVELETLPSENLISNNSSQATVIKNAEITVNSQPDTTQPSNPSEPTTPGSGSSSGGGSSSSVYSTNVPSHISGGKVTVQPTNASAGSKVTIIAKPDSGYQVGIVTVTDKDGKQITVTDAGGNKYTFIMPRSRVDIKVEFIRTQNNFNFTDVQSDAYYYDAVVWAVENGITAGTSATMFSPNAPCTRAQIVTFLWRAAGSPSMGGINPFTDVAPGSYYYDAVQWAVAQGITVGTSTATFSPDATCTRGQAVTFLYHYEKSPAVRGNNAFTDIDANAYYADAVQWAVNNGVTAGTSATTFSPSATCTRGQIVTFLYRDMA